MRRLSSPMLGSAWVDEQLTSSTSRRTFLNGSLTAVAAARVADVFKASSALAQTDRPALPVNFGGEKIPQILQILQISTVVKDAEKVAKRFSDIFGPSWKFYEFRPQQIVLYGKPQTGDCVLKLAIGTCGGHSFKLVQPVSGHSSYMDFLQNHGEGFYSIGLGLGPLTNHDSIVDTLTKAGVGIEMQGDVGDGSKFTVLETVTDLACRVEFNSVPKATRSAFLLQTGSFVPRRPGIVNMDIPVVSGGRRFSQIGLVVKDEKRAAKRYEELLGIGGWHFVHGIPFTTYAIYGKSLAEADLPSAETGQGLTYVGDTQLELVSPVELKPGGIHRAFFDKHGNGFQHLMISPAVGNHESEIEELRKAGFAKEMEASVHSGQFNVLAEYIGMEDQLGGFVSEFLMLEFKG